MDDKSMRHGMFSWFELVTTDPEGAKQFYRNLLGWETEEWPVPDGTSYTLINVGGEQVGGIMGMPPQAAGSPSHWGVYVTVDDVDAVAGRVEGLGGALLMPSTDLPGVGRFCLVRDPRGAVLHLITYARC